LFALTKSVQMVAGDIPVVGNGYTWLRQFMPYVGAANLANGECGFVGLGRSSFAYPEAPREMIAGGLDPQKCCITCSKCTQIMRDHGQTGCVIRDSKVYASLFKDAQEDARTRAKS
jgi:2,4-dienoyl-CoA reductase-like NADH-dependent reductase (Old Yellow Enzyme family)